MPASALRNKRPLWRREQLGESHLGTLALSRAQLLQSADELKLRSVGFVQKLFAAFGVLLLAPSTYAAEPKVYLQSDITAAKIMELEKGYVVDVTLLATDMEEMFMNSRAELKGIDLSSPGILEIEIGRYVAKRITMRDRDGNACASKVDRSGEDPANDEGVLVSLTFECAVKDVFYDASKFLAAHGPRAWQVVTIVHGKAQKQVRINAESPPTPVGAAH